MQIRTIYSVLLALLTLVLVGCSSPLVVIDSSKATQRDLKRFVDGNKIECPDNPSEDLALTRFVTVKNCWDQDTNDQTVRYVGDLYTKLVIEMHTPNTERLGIRDYEAQERSFLERLFNNIDQSSLIVVEASVAQPTVNFTIPVLSLSYASRIGSPETFATSFVQSKVDTPFFRISPNTTISFNISARLSQLLESGYGSNAVSIVLSSLKVAAPQTSLITTLSRDEVSQFSQATDKAISGLTSQSINEAVIVGRNLDEWKKGVTIYVRANISAVVKNDEILQTKNGKGSPSVQLVDNLYSPGVWKIQLACPRFSMFDTRNVCESDLYEKLTSYSADSSSAGQQPGRHSGAFKSAISDFSNRVTSPDVLAFQLANQKTIEQFTREQEWFSGFLQRVPMATLTVSGTVKISADDNGQATSPQAVAFKPEIARFCMNAVNTFKHAGLNTLDSQISLWAIVTGLSDLAAFQQAFQETDVCKEQLEGFGGRMHQFWPLAGSSA